MGYTTIRERERGKEEIELEMSAIFNFFSSSLFFNTFSFEISKLSCMCGMSVEQKNCHYHFEMNIADLCVNVICRCRWFSLLSHTHTLSFYSTLHFPTIKNNGKAIIPLNICRCGRKITSRTLSLQFVWSLRYHARKVFFCFVHGAI